jgi:hypothetical protein
LTIQQDEIRLNLSQSYCRPPGSRFLVFLFTPLATGLFAGGSFTIGSLALVSAAVALFLMWQSLTMTVKVLSGRQGF